jgi:hypothetical protein
MAPVRPVSHRLSGSNETVRDAPKHEFCGPMERIGYVHCEKFRRDFIYRTCALMAPVRPVLHRLSCSSETVRDAPKHEFWV